MQEFKALERALGGEGGSARSSPVARRGRARAPAAVPRLAHAQRGGGQVAALLAPAPRAEGLLAPRRSRGDSDDEEDWRDAPLLFGDLYGPAQQPATSAGPHASQAPAALEVGVSQLCVATRVCTLAN
jgi:hypothetical protein